MKFYIGSSVIMLAFASERSADRTATKLVGAERSGERPLKNGRSVERNVEWDATERA